MKHRITRKGILGILLTLVLVFGVQSTVDAQRVTEVSGDHQNQVPSLSFNNPLVFTISDVTADSQTPAGSAGSVPDPVPAITATTSVNIIASGVTINGVKIGNKTTTTNTTLDYPKVYSPAVTTTTHTIQAERTRLNTALTTYNSANTTLSAGSNRITVSLTAGSSANSSATVKVASGGNTLKTFKFYVAETPSATADFDPASPTTNAVYRNTIGSSTERQISFSTNGSADHMLMDFSISSGSGGLYFDNDDRDRNRSQKRQTVGINATTDDAAIFFRPPGSGVTIIQAAIRGTNKRAYQTLFSSAPKLVKVDDVGGRKGVIGTRLPDPFVVEVRDGPTGTHVPNQNVQFQLSFKDRTNTELNEAKFVSVDDSNTTVTAGAADTTLSLNLQTNEKGRAGVYLTLGVDALTGSPPLRPGAPDDVGTYTVKALLTDTPAGATPTAWDTKIFKAQSVDETTEAIIEIVSGNKQRVDAVSGAPDDPLRVRVLNRNRQIVHGEPVSFRATVGTVTGAASSGQFVTETTDELGEAAVAFVIGDIRGDAQVRAVINPATQHEQAVTFTVYGRGSTTPTTPTTNQPPSAQRPTTTTLTVASSISGAPGATQVLQITSPLRPTVGTLTDTFRTAGGSATPAGGTGPLYTTTLTLPSTVGAYSLTVSAGTATRTVSVTVTGATTTTPTQTTGTLSISVPFSGAPGSQQITTVTATDSDGNAASGVTVTLAVTNGGGTFSPASVTTGTDGTAISGLTRGSTVGTNYFVTANATGYTEGRTRISITGGSTPPTTTTPTTGTTPTTPASGDPSLISITGDSQRSGTVNQQLATPLSVEVLDSKGGPADARVIFRVRSGQGRLSQRGNGRAVAVQTDARGNASADYTPMSANSTVVASVGGVSETVTFTVTTGAAPATSTPGTGTSTTTPIEPKVLVAAANRPAMYWIDSGMLYGLTGANATKIAESVNGAAVGGGKVYWTEQTGNSAGTINAANLDGSGVKQLTSILAVPMGIAVDTAGSKLYWTNSRGRIQSANLDGSGIRNVRQNLSDPTDIVLSDTHIYWVASGDTIRRVNMTGTRVVQDVAVGLMNVGGIAIGGGKVYWTEKTGASAGTITGANLDGTQFKTLATIQAVPMGIAVDTTDQKLYWTNSRGRVQRANLNGSSIKNVVDGLGSPSHIAIGGATTATAAKPTTQPTETQQPKKDTAKYDVNGDGTVDNVDASLVSGAMGTDNKKYDVNGDGTVNFLDLLLVFDNRDDDAAGAPTVLGMKLTAVQIDVIQEQIDLLIATGDRSPAAIKTLIYLQQLIATARPEKTQLLANYPNPFNPETWIPYELATDTTVKITIYNTQGVVIRTLELGHQSAGYYTGRDRAAYWDGRNALGEQVASGIYFYQLETDTMSAMRKMVILK